MIEVKIGSDGVVTPAKIILGNKWENKDEQIHFDLPQEFDNYNKYVIAVMRQSTGTSTVTLPIGENNNFYITNKLTYLNGNWNMYVMCREQEINLDSDVIDVTAQKGEEHVFISNVFTGTVNNNLIEQDALNDTTLDANLQTIYDDLIALRNTILDKIGGKDEEVITSYKDLTDKPTINGKELNGDMSIYDLNSVPIHALNAKSFSALYKAIKTTGLSIDEEDVSTFLFVLSQNEIEGKFDSKFVELNIFKIYRAEYNPFVNEAIVNCDDFTLTIKAEGIIALEKHSTSGTSDFDSSLLDGKLDVYQGIENVGKTFVVGEDGYITSVDPSYLNSMKDGVPIVDLDN